MLRVEFKDGNGSVTLKIEGRFVGQFAEDLRDLVLRRKLPSAVMVDLSDVIFVDDTGEEVLSWFGRLGARFVSENAYSSDVCKRLALPMLSSPYEHSSKPNGRDYGTFNQE